MKNSPSVSCISHGRLSPCRVEHCVTYISVNHLSLFICLLSWHADKTEVVNVPLFLQKCFVRIKTAKQITAISHENRAKN